MKKYILLVSAAILLAACNSEDNYMEEPVVAQISATIGQGAASRACDEKWTEGDEIGVTMGDLYINRKYTTESGDGTFTGALMYFKNKKDKLTVSAYYPYSGAEGTSAPVVETSTDTDRQTATEQPKIDFMYTTMDGVSGAQPDVNLRFYHKMSKLTLIFKNGNEGTDVGKIISYKIDGLILDGTFNPLDGVCMAKADGEARSINIEMPLGTVKDGARVFPLILFPQVVNKLPMRIHDSEGQDYVCELNIGADGLVAGNNYLFTITVKKTSLSVSSSIVDWETETGSSEAKSDDSDD
ncbi:MAG: fimbrillin family protein [Bacteroidaceae bacterium]|nr:fimbrillin family protein [Bacteroidaceae bacterium]